MKQLLLLSTLFLTIVSCSINKKPEFIALQNIKVVTYSSKQITLKADALFKNPNDVSGTLKTDGINVLVNGNSLAKVSATAFNVPKQKNFTVPLTAIIPTDSLYSNNSISGLLGSLINKKIKVQYIGELKYTILGFSHVYNVNEIQDVSLKF